MRIQAGRDVMRFHMDVLREVMTDVRLVLLDLTGCLVDAYREGREPRR